MKMQKKIRVLFADDHQIMLDGLASLLQNETHIEVAGVVHSGREVLEFLQKETAPVDVAVLDINMPDMDGIETARQLRDRHKEVKTLILSMFALPGYILDATRAGASGYILKDRGREELVSAIEELADGGTFYSREVAKILLQQTAAPGEAHTFTLTKREKEVLALIGAGKTSPEIGKELYISTQTVDTHRRNLLSKLGLRNSMELVRYAVENGFVR
jgi:DNA-binding NarL/FixJ family response regulator